MTFTQFIKSTFGKEAPKNEEMTVHQLVDKWGWMHIPRTALHATALVCSAYAICSEDLSFFEYVLGPLFLCRACPGCFTILIG